jgi:hypothetical protein
MAKKFLNESGTSAVSILLALLFYVILASIAVSFLLMNLYGVSNIVPELPSQKDIQMFSSDQNFKTGEFNISVVAKDINSKWIRTPEAGYVLTQLGGQSYSYLAIDYIQKDINGYYQNSYWINNTATNMLGRHGDYCIILRFTGGIDQNEVCIKSDGFHIPAYLLDSNTQWGDKFIYPYPEANQVEYPDIKTIYHDNPPSLTFYFNDVKQFETTQLNQDQNLFSAWGRYYGGVGSYTLGFTMEDFKTDNSIISGQNSANGQDILGMLGAMIITIIKISTWSIPAQFLPTELVMIFITIPEAGIIICAAIVFLRGVS